MAEEILKVDVGGNKIIGDPNAPNEDTNTIVKVVKGEGVTTLREEKETPAPALKFQLVTTITLNILLDQQG